jgi:hypothetical protein
VSLRPVKNTVLAGLVVAFPCYVFLLFCNGVLPVGAMAILAVRLILKRDPAALILLIPLVLEAAIYLFVLNKLAQRITRHVHRDSSRTRILVLAFLAGSIAWTIVPINAFDCMDGHPLTRCSAFRMYLGWLRQTVPGSTLYQRARCGDFRW